MYKTTKYIFGYTSLLILNLFVNNFQNYSNITSNTKTYQKIDPIKTVNKCYLKKSNKIVFCTDNLNSSEKTFIDKFYLKYSKQETDNINKLFYENKINFSNQNHTWISTNLNSTVTCGRNATYFPQYYFGTYFQWWIDSPTLKAFDEVGYSPVGLLASICSFFPELIPFAVGLTTMLFIYQFTNLYLYDKGCGIELGVTTIGYIITYVLSQ